MGPRPNENLKKADATQVTAFLRAHPRFLADHPDLYRALVPPARVHGAGLADHMAAMLTAERAHAATMSEQAQAVLAASRAAAGLAARVHEAVLALIGCDNPVECIAHEWPVLLAVDAVSLCSEANDPALRHLPAGLVEELLGTRSVVFATMTGCTSLVHGEATPLARHEALIRVPGNRPPTLLALASRDGATLDPLQGTTALAFLGRVAATALAQ